MQSGLGTDILFRYVRSIPALQAIVPSLLAMSLSEILLALKNKVKHFKDQVFKDQVWENCTHS